MKWEIENGRIIYFLDLLFACDAVFHLFSVVIIDKYTSVFFFQKEKHAIRKPFPIFASRQILANLRGTRCPASDASKFWLNKHLCFL